MANVEILNGLKNISAKAGELCELVFDLKVAILGNWRKVADKDLPRESGEYITICKNKNMKDGICLYEVSYWTGSEWDNRKHYEDIIAWMKLPEYTEE